MTAAARLLERLEAVRETGPGRWVARCPSHDDRGPSLSIRDADGKTLIHCFAGCAALDVVHAAGLELADLFDDRQYRPGAKSRPRVPAGDLLLIAAHEVTVAWLVADRMVTARLIEADDWVRLKKAVGRLARIAAEVQPMTKAVPR